MVRVQFYHQNPTSGKQSACCPWSQERGEAQARDLSMCVEGWLSIPIDKGWIQYRRSLSFGFLIWIVPPPNFWQVGNLLQVFPMLEESKVSQIEEHQCGAFPATLRRIKLCLKEMDQEACDAQCLQSVGKLYLKNNSQNVEVIPDFCPKPEIARETARLLHLYNYDRHHSLNGSFDTRVLVAGRAKPIFNGSWNLTTAASG